MKKIVIVAATAFFIAVLIPILTLVFTFGSDSTIQDGQVLQGFATVLKDGFVSCYLLDLGGGKVALLDTGMDSKGARIMEELKNRKLTQTAVSAILLTHGHPDNIAACPLFPKVRIYALTAESGLIEGKETSRGSLTNNIPSNNLHLKVTNPLQNGQSFKLGRLLVHVFAVPGHTAGSAAYLINGVLFLGDSAGASRYGRVAPAKYIFSDNQKQDIASLKNLAEALRPSEAQVKVLAFSHTGVLEGLKPLLDFASTY